jgi:hypothetical protein
MVALPPPLTCDDGGITKPLQPIRFRLFTAVGGGNMLFPSTNAGPTLDGMT